MVRREGNWARGGLGEASDSKRLTLLSPREDFTPFMVRLWGRVVL